MKTRVAPSMVGALEFRLDCLQARYSILQYARVVAVVLPSITDTPEKRKWQRDDTLAQQSSFLLIVHGSISIILRIPLAKLHCEHNVDKVLTHWLGIS